MKIFATVRSQTLLCCLWLILIVVVFVVCAGSSVSLLGRSGASLDDLKVPTLTGVAEELPPIELSPIGPDFASQDVAGSTFGAMGGKPPSASIRPGAGMAGNAPEGSVVSRSGEAQTSQFVRQPGQQLGQQPGQQTGQQSRQQLGQQPDKKTGHGNSTGKASAGPTASSGTGPVANLGAGSGASGKEQGGKGQAGKELGVPEILLGQESFEVRFFLTQPVNGITTSFQKSPAAWMIDLPGQWKRSGKEEVAYDHSVVRKLRITPGKEYTRLKLYCTRHDEKNRNRPRLWSMASR